MGNFTPLQEIGTAISDNVSVRLALVHVTNKMSITGAKTVILFSGVQFPSIWGVRW